ncbi:MAG: P-II family nitrogen regulator [Spirochaetaceae bacterium]|nr:MAG: P-II family nitrogen regulator [Spirochaetaceae bacterium]
MKEVMAVIRMNKINQTKRALADAGINAVTAKEVLGRGKGLIDFNVLHGAEKGYEEAIAHLGHSQRLVPKRMLTIIVPDKQVAKVVKTITEVNQTGKSGDGKIFVMPVLDALQVRTGDSGDKVLDN